jgi:ketosteroid isomerase-like protein
VAPTNLALVRSIYAAWERGDYSSAEWADPQIEFVMTGGPTPGSWTGLAGMAQAMRDWLSAWEGFHQEAEEYREVDSERVLVFLRWGGRGKTSGLELGQVGAKGASLFHIRDAKVTRLVYWDWDRDRVLAELGLSSEAGSTHS